MDRSRIWIIGAIVAMVAVVIFGALLGVQPQLAAASAANEQQQSIAQQNAIKQAALEKLKTDFEHLPELKKSLAELQKSVPPQADLPAFITDLNALAATTGTVVSGFTASDAQPYVPPVATVVPGPGATATPSPGASDAAGASATASPAPKPATPQAPAPVTNAKITGGNFVAIPLKVTVTGNYEQALAFVDGLQHGSRLFLVTNFASNGTAATASADTAAASADAAPTSWTVSGYAYVLLDGSKAGAAGQ